MMRREKDEDKRNYNETIGAIFFNGETIYLFLNNISNIINENLGNVNELKFYSKGAGCLKIEKENYLTTTSFIFEDYLLMSYVNETTTAEGNFKEEEINIKYKTPNLKFPSIKDYFNY